MDNTKFENYNKMIARLDLTPEDRNILSNLLINEQDKTIKHAMDEFCKYLFETNPFAVEIDRNSRSKIIHSLKTVIISQELCKRKNLNSEERRINSIIALLHDIGRFDQIRSYSGTGQYYVKEGHPEKGAHLLFSENMLIRRFLSDDSYDIIIENAIKFHGAKSLPYIPDKEELMFCTIIRDSDILENLLHKSRYTKKELMRNLAINEEELQTLGEQDISSNVFQSALNHSTVTNSDRKTKIDFLVGYLCLTYGLKYNESLNILKEDGAVPRLFQLIKYTGNTNNKMKMIYKVLDHYINSKTQKPTKSNVGDKERWLEEL